MDEIVEKFKKRPAYFGYFLVFLISFATASLLPVAEIFKGIATFPAVGSLFLLLLQLWRDDRAQERAQELQYKQQDFMLGTASHMADVVYDKHAEFCEEYIARVQQGFQELLREGASRNAINIGRELVNIRQRHSAWLTKEIERKLKPFEQALIEIGANKHLLEDLPVGEERTRVVSEVYKFFGLIIDIKKARNKEEAEMSIEQNIENIREILGVNILTELRLKASELALKRVKGNTHVL